MSTPTAQAIPWIESNRAGYWITEWREGDRQWEIVQHANAATLSVRWHPSAPFTRVAERANPVAAMALAAMIED